MGECFLHSVVAPKIMQGYIIIHLLLRARTFHNCYVFYGVETSTFHTVKHIQCVMSNTV